MATKTYTDIQDRVINSLVSIQKGEWYDAMQTYQDYPMVRMARTMGKEKSGKQLNFKIGVGSDNEDGHAGLYEDFDVDRPDVMTQGTLDWMNHRKGFGIDEREIDAMGDYESLVDDMIVQYNNMWTQVGDDFETKAWQIPAVNDKLLPNGIPYFVVWEDSSAGKFTSYLPGSHADVAGVDPAIQDKYQNWSCTYVNATRDDLGLRFSRAVRKTNWRPPINVRGDQKVTHVAYMDLETIENNEIMAANQNDQLGRDSQPMLNRSMIARITPTWAPILDDVAASGSNPIYLINHAYLYPCFKRGWKFREYPPTQAAKQRTVVETHVFTVYNYSCQLRNRQAVIAKSQPFAATAN